MRTAVVLLLAGFSGVAGALFPIAAPPAQASVLTQIDDARQFCVQSGLSVLPVTKHYVEVSPGIFLAVKGEKERRQVRFARWLDGLRGDRRAVYEAEGFPTHRHFESYAGDRTELWVYSEHDLVYVFRGDVLEDVRTN